MPLRARTLRMMVSLTVHISKVRRIKYLSLVHIASGLSLCLYLCSLEHVRLPCPSAARTDRSCRLLGRG